MPTPAAPSSPIDPIDDTAAAVRALGPDVMWVADIVPLLRRDADAPEIRHAFVLVMANSIQIVADLLSAPIADHAAALLASKVREAIDIVGIAPTTLIIRGQLLAEEVQSALPDVPVEGVDTLYDIIGPEGDAFTAAALELRHAMDGEMIPNAPTSVSPRWSSWGLSNSDVASFFAASAALYRTAQGCSFTGDGAGTIFILETPGEGEVLVTLTGTESSPRRPASVTVYNELEDWDAMVESAREDPRTADVRHPIMSFQYVPIEELDLGAIAEIRANGWEIAATTAYPWVWFLNAIGGGVTSIYLQTLTSQLNSLSRALATLTVPIDIDLTLRYFDRDTGIEVRSIAA